MYLKNSILLFLISFNLFAQSKLPPELLTKQAIQNIRFISDDGKVTYFQKDSGGLSITTNYQTTEIVKEKPNTQFSLVLSPLKKKLLLSAFTNFLDSQSFLRTEDISVSDYQGKDFTKLGSGTHARLHLQDDWVSYYEPGKKQIHYHKLSGSKSEFTIKLKNQINPYFTPQTILLSDTTALITDLNTQGYEILYRFDSLTGNFTQIYKTTQAGMKLELCRNKQQLVIGQFSLGDTANGSLIMTVDIDPQFTLKKMDVIYSSNLNDLGNIVCEGLDDEVYFIKALTKESDINIKNTEVAKLNLNSKQFEVLTQIGDASQITRLDSRILIPYRGKLLVIKGESNQKSDDLTIKKSEKPSASQEESQEEINLEIGP